jgi:hypothetical protein
MPAASAPAASGTTKGSGKRPNPRDYSGVQKARLEAEHAEELEERAAEVALASAAQRVRRATEVVDYSHGGHAAPEQVQPAPTRSITPELVAELEEAEVEVENPTIVIRVSSKIEDMVFGRDAESGLLNFYSFDEGVRYRVPVALAIHLDEIGYLYH